MKKLLLSLSLIFVFTATTKAQSGYDIKINFKGCKDTMAFLVKYTFDQQYIADTCKKIKNGLILFKGKKDLIKVYEVLEQEKVSAIESSNGNSVRMYSRVQLKTFVSIVKGNFRSNGLIRDISIGGVSIGTVGSYNPDDIIVMTFKLNNNITFRNIKGIVKHIEKSMFEAKTMGVEFIDFEEDRLKELVDFIDAENKRALS